MPNSLEIPYVDEKSQLYHTIRRPKLNLSIYSRNLHCLVKVENILADTGADISVLPKSLGTLILGDFKHGRRYRVSGLTLTDVSNMYIQKLSVRIGNRTFRTDFAISNSDDIPPTLGRVGALDKFEVVYSKGKKLVIRW
jgi:hypothetical protein